MSVGCFCRLLPPNRNAIAGIRARRADNRAGVQQRAMPYATMRDAAGDVRVTGAAQSRTSHTPMAALLGSRRRIIDLLVEPT